MNNGLVRSMTSLYDSMPGVPRFGEIGKIMKQVAVCRSQTQNIYPSHCQNFILALSTYYFIQKSTARNEGKRDVHADELELELEQDKYRGSESHDLLYTFSMS